MSIGTILASTIVTEVARRLNDTNNTNKRWDGTDILTSLNSGQKMIAEVRPAASVKAVSVLMVAGFEQILPTADGKEFLALSYNSGTAGTTKGKAIVQMQESLLDAINSEWRSITGTEEIEYFAPNPDFPGQYLVYPPNDGTGYAHLRYNSIPIDVAATTDPINIGDEYREPLILATVWFALADATENPQLMALRQDILSQFQATMGIKVTADAPVDRNR